MRPAAIVIAFHVCEPRANHTASFRLVVAPRDPSITFEEVTFDRLGTPKWSARSRPIEVSEDRCLHAHDVLRLAALEMIDLAAPNDDAMCVGQRAVLDKNHARIAIELGLIDKDKLHA